MTYPKEALSSCGAVNRATCFVIMPFAQDFDAVYHRIRETLAEAPINIVCVRADDIRKPNIIDTLVRSIAESEFVIADLTGLNPNVFYEVGIAHSVKDAEKVLLISQDVGTLPFDLKQMRCVEYRRSAAGIRALKLELIQTFSDMHRDAYRFQLREGETRSLGARLTGEERNIFDLNFRCAHAGREGIKLRVDYQRFSLDDAQRSAESDEFYVGRGERPAELMHVPWSVQFLGSGDGGASLLLERDERRLG